MAINTLAKMFTFVQLQFRKPIITYPLFRTCFCSHNSVSAVFPNIRTSCTNFIVKISDHKCKKKKEKGIDREKARIILSLNFKSTKDAKPFYQLPLQTILHVQRVTINDRQNGYCENRLYYISSKIQCPSEVVSVKLANRTFVYSLSFEWLENSLNELLEKGVTGERIIRDLWVLKYHHNTIRERLQNVKDMGIENLYPWMVRCLPKVLDRYMNITKETKSILGDTKSTQMYLAKRLNVSMEDIQDMCAKIPALKTIRATKVKKFIDFLLDEGYDVAEIAQKPRILASSQKTVKLRLQELNLLGVKHVNLNVLCRSRKDYKRYREGLDIESQKK